MTPRSVLPQPTRPAGSPDAGEPVFLVIGKLLHPHGVHGEILMDVLTDFPERIHVGVTVYVGEEHALHKILSRRVHRNALLITFGGYTNRDQIGVFRNQMVYVRADDRPDLPDGEYYHHQLLGLRVIDQLGAELGLITEILETGANDVLLVHPPAGKDILIPVIESTLLRVDMSGGFLQVQVMPGIIPDE
jgi:16S rRNA processing protein RimM